MRDFQRSLRQGTQRNSIMGLFGKLFGKEAHQPRPAAQLPQKQPDWLLVEGEWVDLTTLSPAQLVALEVYLTTQRQAREQQLVEYLHGLAAERARLLEGQDPATWLMTLKLMFGEDLGRRVAAQDVGPGMQLQHVVMSFGLPNYVHTDGPRVLLRYAPDSEVELDGEQVSRAVIGQRPALPENPAVR